MNEHREIRDVDDLADELLPVDGPHTPDGVLAAAGLISELVRRLNHATLPERTDRSLPYPAAVDSVVGRLQGALGSMPQLLGQLARRLDELAHDPRLYDDRGAGAADPPSEVATFAAEMLRSEAVAYAKMTTQALRVVRANTNHLGVRETPSTRDGEG